MFSNTAEFTRDAQFFLKHKRYDCGASGTTEYEEWWDEQERRRDNGMIIGDVAITGEHYGYLNFAQILLTDDPDYKESGMGTRRKGTKKKSFPDFYDGDFTYFWAKQIARDGIENGVL